ncbi:hypothetical protein EWB00_001246 [Schistosoma japonicum]|uniref:SJCHGC00455 protein n=3 Tax=Schistosoma japonicum TaxID=6182 RepID=Q5DAT3_SCHJA|nr:SJCHGC00455 protein [Schistosoma japonicum]TNN15510.1 hypothetical protein EWB00_001246 [Schistosoma japonicum]
MNRMIWSNYTRSFYRSHFKYSLKSWYRSFVPASYTSAEIWNARLSHDIFKKISARDHGLKILQKINAGQTVSPLDYDIFANKLDEMDVTFLDFIEEVITSYMNTQTAVTVKDSTCHAFIRSYLNFQEEDRLLKLLQERSKTGIFVDFASAVLLMDVFLRKGEWNSAVAVSWELCLQEYFSLENIRPLVYATSMLSCIKSIEHDSYVDSESQPDDDEVVERKFVPYVRNQNYDNFFDIKRPRLKAGYTLLHLSNALNTRCSVFQSTPMWNSLSKCVDSLRLMMKIFGLALSEQCSQLLIELRRIEGPVILLGELDSVVIEKLRKIIDTCMTRPDDLSLMPGEPHLPCISDVKLVQKELLRIQGESHGATSSFFKTIENFVFNNVFNNPACMDQEIEAISNLYVKFNEERIKEYTETIKMEHQENVVKNVKEKLKQLLDEEERITYFQNSMKIMRSAWLAPRTHKETQWSRLKEWRKEVSNLRQKEDNSSVN